MTTTRLALTSKNSPQVRAWTDALRSGEYPQGIGRLRSPSTGRYCCLGVGSEVAGIERDEISSKMLAPARFIEWLGLTDDGDGYGDDWDITLDLPDHSHFRGISDTLSKLNDDRYTFNQIADLIDYFGIAYAE